MKRLAFALAALLCAAAPSLAADQAYSVLNGLSRKLKDMGDGTYAEQLHIGGGSVGGPLPPAVTAGQARIATTSTAICLGAAALVNGIVVKALADTQPAAPRRPTA